jgi:hypothetical protein
VTLLLLLLLRAVVVMLLLLRAVMLLLLLLLLLLLRRGLVVLRVPGAHGRALERVLRVRSIAAPRHFPAVHLPAIIVRNLQEV